MPATWRLTFTTIDNLPSDHTFASNAVQLSHMRPGFFSIYPNLATITNVTPVHRSVRLRPWVPVIYQLLFLSLKRHALLHGGVRPFSCSTCNKGFYQRVICSSLKPLGNCLCRFQVAWMTHMKSHTSDRLPCPACSKPFLTQYLLNQV